MKILKIFTFIIVNFFVIFNFSYAEQNLKFADIDAIIKNTNIGKKVLNKLNKLDENNIQKLNKLQNELKSKENDINVKKNLLSENELQNEIEKLNIQFANYNKKKNEMIKNLSDIKNKELENIFKIINPIIQNYMKKNSIDILFNSKNIFIGNKKSDLTEELVEVINMQADG
tara:strand:- start:768 stop:1283 length:516 start_codon:yes stop_codon:yes gene_type:complete